MIDVFVDAFDLADMSFEGADRPAVVPSVGPAKLYIYGVQSSGRFEEAGCNIEVMCLPGRLAVLTLQSTIVTHFCKPGPLL